MKANARAAVTEPLGVRDTERKVISMIAERDDTGAVVEPEPQAEPAPSPQPVDATAPASLDAALENIPPADVTPDKLSGAARAEYDKLVALDGAYGNPAVFEQRRQAVIKYVAKTYGTDGLVALNGISDHRQLDSLWRAAKGEQAPAAPAKPRAPRPADRQRELHSALKDSRGSPTAIAKLLAQSDLVE